MRLRSPFLSKVQIAKEIHQKHNPFLCLRSSIGLCAFGFRRRRRANGGHSAAACATAPSAGNFQGSVTKGQASAQAIDLSLDDAIQRGLQANLGIILSSTQTAGARAQRLSQLQSLLPSVDFAAKETVMQTDLPAEGLRIPGFPKSSSAPSDSPTFAPRSAGRWSMWLRCATTWPPATTLPPRNSRRRMRATWSCSPSATPICLCWPIRPSVSSVQAQVATSKISLDQAVDNHQAGTAPLLDELRARVDYQSLEQQLIVAQNALEKDKLALARTIGLPLAQSFNLTDRRPTRPSTSWTRMR